MAEYSHLFTNCGFTPHHTAYGFNATTAAGTLNALWARNWRQKFRFGHKWVGLTLDTQINVIYKDMAMGPFLHPNSACQISFLAYISDQLEQ